MFRPIRNLISTRLRRSPLPVILLAACFANESRGQTIQRPNFAAGDRVLSTVRFESEPAGTLVTEQQEISITLKSLTRVARSTRVTSAADGRPSGEETHLLSSYTVSRFATLAGAEQTNYQPHPLDDRIIRSAQTGSSWQHKLEGESPTPEQQQKLDLSRTLAQLIPLPEKPIALGESWEIPALRALDLFALEDVHDPTGGATLTFEKTLEEGGEKFALVKVAVKVSGLEQNPRGLAFNFGLDFEGRQWIRLADMLPSRTELAGTISLDGELEPGVRLNVTGAAKLHASMERIREE